MPYCHGIGKEPSSSWFSEILAASCWQSSLSKMVSSCSFEKKSPMVCWCEKWTILLDLSRRFDEFVGTTLLENLCSPKEVDHVFFYNSLAFPIKRLMYAYHRCLIEKASMAVWRIPSVCWDKPVASTRMIIPAKLTVGLLAGTPTGLSHQMAWG